MRRRSRRQVRFCICFKRVVGAGLLRAGWGIVTVLAYLRATPIASPFCELILFLDEALRDLNEPQRRRTALPQLKDKHRIADRVAAEIRRWHAAFFEEGLNLAGELAGAHDRHRPIIFPQMRFSQTGY